MAFVEETSNSGNMQEYLDRVDRLEMEKKTIQEDIKSVWEEAKKAGFDVAMLKKAHSLQKLDKSKRETLGGYTDVLGIWED